MPEQLLDGKQVGAGIEQMGCERVAEGVGGETAVVGDAVEEGADDVLDLASGETAAALGQEECRAIGGRGTGDDFAAARLMSAEGGDGGRANGDNALLAALAEDAGLLGDEIDAGEIETGELGQADAVA
jgi:hypothetical protein